MNGGDSGPVPTIDKPSDETLEKIDFVIQGVENGLFKDLSKKIDFHQKLKGEDPSRFIQSLLDVIETQKHQITDLQMARDQGNQQIIDLQGKISDIEITLQNHVSNMRGVANGLGYLSKPDPFGTDYNTNWDTASTETFINEWKNKYS